MSSGSSTTSWIPVTSNFTATRSVLSVIFGFDAASNVYLLVDDVSIVRTANPSVELLDNPGFDNSTSDPTGWDAWCSSTCGSSSGGVVTNSGCRNGYCYKGQCRGGSYIDYVVQTFPAIINQTYTWKYWYKRIVSSGSSSATLYAAII